jgi:hypothetical protein
VGIWTKNILNKLARVGLAAPGLIADAISYVKMCALSALCALTVPLLSFLRGGSVRLKRLKRVCENQDLRIQSRRDG